MFFPQQNCCTSHRLWRCPALYDQVESVTFFDDDDGDNNVGGLGGEVVPRAVDKIKEHVAEEYKVDEAVNICGFFL